ncbi:MAG: FG-GAP-like repeat-containing protein [Myxococcota bacterium]
MEAASSTGPVATSALDSTGPDQPTGDGTTGGSSSTTEAGGDDVLFDLPVPDTRIVGPSCTVDRDGSGVGTCEETAPPDSFDPDVQWEWTGATLTQSVTTPVVANLTDDDGNGTIDLCDIPDVVIVAFGGFGGAGRIVVLSGDDGSEHFEIPADVNFTVTPALGDIDDDGVPEIITTTTLGNLIAFEHDGSVAWTSPTTAGTVEFAGPALADLDGDGRVEIMIGGAVYDDMGVQLWNSGDVAGPSIGSLVTAADLDGDGDLEVIHGTVAYHHDGSPYYDTGLPPGFPHVADFDGDPDPEIILMNQNGINLIEHDGTIVWQDQRPTGDPNTPFTVWLKPGTVHDFDGDDVSEFATGSANNYTAYEITPAGPSILWQAPVLDASGSAGGTAFDFDGDGLAEAMYADETQLFVFDAMGAPLLASPRQSGTGLEYPVVADVDNDGSAEIVVVSNFQPIGGSPAVAVIRDVEDRWIQARRIWNQHTYHVSNVREDGTIPAVEPRSWQQLNTFRTNAQIEGGGICVPPG